MRVPSASLWGGRSLPLVLLLLVFAAAVLAAPPVRLLADKPECFKETGNEV
jgi:hypothetical protein